MGGFQYQNMEDILQGRYRNFASFVFEEGSGMSALDCGIGHYWISGIVRFVQEDLNTITFPLMINLMLNL